MFLLYPNNLGATMLKSQNNDDYKYLRRMKRYPLINREEFARLVASWRTGGDKEAAEAHEKMFGGNIGLVISEAPRYQNRGLDFLDIVQEGLIGLEKSFKTFDPARGAISTYATRTIRRSICRALDNKAHTIRISVQVRERMRLVKKTIEGFEMKFGRRPTDQEVYDQIHVDDGKDDQPKLNAKMTLAMIASCRPLLEMGTVSLNIKINSAKEGGQLTLIENIRDQTVDTEAEIDLVGLQKSVFAYVKQIAEKNPLLFNLLCLRFESGALLKEIGDHFGLNHQRVSQIEKNLVAEIAAAADTTTEGVRTTLQELPLRSLITAKSEPSKTVPVSKLFGILCEHVILTPAEMRIVKEPVRTLQMRKNILPEQAEAALEKMYAYGLIEGQAPWTIIRIVPEVPIPEYKSYK